MSDEKWGDQTFYEAVLSAADRLTDPAAGSTLRVVVAKALFESGRIDAAFACIATLSSRTEKRQVLLDLALDTLATARTEHLVRLVRVMAETDPASTSVAGRLADSLLDLDKTESALELLHAVDKPFGSDRDRYDFFVKYLQKSGDNGIDEASRLLESFHDVDYRDWARLELARRLVRSGRLAEAEKTAAAFSLLPRQSWAFFELSRLVSGEKGIEWLLRAGEILESVSIDAEKNPEGIERLSIQFRIMGNAAFESGAAELAEPAERWLEEAEAAAAAIPVSMQRLRCQYFIAKVLRQRNRIDSVGTYLDRNELSRLNLTGIDRSRVLQWIAEAGAGKGAPEEWIAAVEATVAVADRDSDVQKAERIVETVRRFAARNRKEIPTGDPATDAVVLSGEAFEAYYFSPFSIVPCDC